MTSTRRLFMPHACGRVVVPADVVFVETVINCPQCSATGTANSTRVRLKTEVKAAHTVLGSCMSVFTEGQVRAAFLLLLFSPS